MNRFILIIITFFAIIVNGFSQNIRFNVFDVNSTNYPTCKISFYLIDSLREFVDCGAVGDWTVKDNGVNPQNMELKCDKTIPNETNSILLTIDQSIGVSTSNIKLFDYAKSAYVRAINTINYKNSFCALSSYDVNSYMLSDFSKIKDSLLKTVSYLKSQPASSGNIGFNNSLTGAFDVIAPGNGSKTIILFTDAYADFNADSIISRAKSLNVKINVLYFSGKAPIEFHKIAESTSGIVFESINDETSALNSIDALIKNAEGYAPSTLLWTNEIDCSDVHSLNILNPKLNIDFKYDYYVSTIKKTSLRFNPPYLEFSSILPNTLATQEIFIEAVNSDIILKGFSIGSSRFTIKEGNISNQILLKKGDLHRLLIEFAPEDSAIIFTKLKVISNACSGDEVYITGGFPNSPPKFKNIKIAYPNCGNTLVIGDTIDVVWQGLLPKDVIQLEYSLDAGKKWTSMARNIDGLSFRWPVPNVETDGLIVQAIQMWPNNVGKTMDLRHKGAVNGAYFNKLGDRVVTASYDSTAVIWNSNTGDKVKTLKHNAKVNHAIFDPKGTMIVTASDDSTANVYNSTTGELILKLPHPDKVKCAFFNPSSDRIVTVAEDFLFRVFDMKGIITLQKYIPQVRWANFDLNGTHVTTCANDGVVRMYDFNGKETKSIDSKNTGEFVGQSQHVTYNTDGSKIAVSNMITKNTIVLDANTGKRLYSVTHVKDTSTITINSSTFFLQPEENVEYLLTSGTDNQSRRWFAKDGGIPKGSDGKDTLHVFAEHKKSVQTSVFNFDGVRLLTASWDSTAKIWNLNQRDLQRDSTTCLISIAKAKVITNNFDIGSALTGAIKIRHCKNFIKNAKGFEFKVRNIEMIDGDISDFQVLSGKTYPYLLKANDSIDFLFKFSPTKSGLRKARFRIIIPADTIYAEVSGTGIDNDMLVTPDMVNFKNVDIDEFRDTVTVGYLSNKSGKDLNISKIIVNGPDTNHFFILDKIAVPFKLENNKGIDLRLRFMPEYVNRRNSTIAVYHDGIGSPTILNLFGVGTYPAQDSFYLQIPDFYGEPGSIVTTPVRLRNVTKHGAIARLQGLTLTLAYNSTLIAPLDQTLSDTIVGQVRTTQYGLGTTFNSDSSIAVLKFKVALGNDTITKLNIRDIAVTGEAKLRIRYDVPIFRLTGWCGDGGPRLFDPTGKQYLAQNVPNPANNSSIINFSLAEPGETSLEVFNYLGENVLTVFKKNMVAGAYSVEINSSILPAGTYYYVLTTPTTKFSKTMQIEK